MKLKILKITFILMLTATQYKLTIHHKF